MVEPTLDNSNTIIEGQLDVKVERLQQVLCSDVLTFLGPVTYGVDDFIRNAVESFEERKDKLVVILETRGGYIEITERIADTLRRHYGYVEFIIPNHAMSAGTVLVMSGDAIYMDYYSVLGPIDPQLERPDGKDLFPALGYLIQYERLIDKSRRGVLTTAELAYLVERFDPAELYRYEQARELSISLLEEWLVKYKFKNWKQTETRKIRVSKAMRTKRANKIAKLLNETKRWHSHGRGIPMEVLRRDLQLKIEDFGENAELNDSIGSYYKLLVDYMMRRGHTIIVHTKGRYIGL